MRILVLAINYWPDETGIAPFNTGRCEFLAERGHKVTVCTAPPYYPQWRVQPEYKKSVFRREDHNGVAILRSWLYVPARVTSAKRLLHEASFIATSFLNALRAERPDVMIVISAPLGLGVSAALLSRFWDVPLIFHVEDLQPDAAADLGMMRVRGLMRSLYALERLIYKKAHLVTTLTEGMRSRIVSKGVAQEKVALSRHWSESGLFELPIGSSTSQFRRKERLQDKFVVLHAGNMGVKQGLEVVIEAANLTKGDNQIRYLFVGDGAAASLLRSQAVSLSLPNVSFLGVHYGEDFRDVLCGADLCLVTQRRGVADILFPSKVLTLLASARPVAASLEANSEVAHVLAESGAGVLLEPENPRLLADGILSIRQKPFLLRQMAASGRSYAQNRWSRERALLEMEQQILYVAARYNAGRRRDSNLRRASHECSGDRFERLDRL